MTSSATTTARGKSGATATICRSRKKNSREEREPVPLRSLGIRRASGTRRSARGGRRAAAARLKASPSFDQTGARAFQASETFDHTVEREPSGEGDVRIRQWSASLSGEREFGLYGNAMKRWTISVVLTCAALVSALSRPVALARPQDAVTAIVGGTIVDGNGGPPIADAVLLVAGTRITAVRPRRAVTIPADAHQI